MKRCFAEICVNNQDGNNLLEMREISHEFIEAIKLDFLTFERNGSTDPHDLLLNLGI